MGNAQDTKPANAFLEPYIWNQYLMVYSVFQIPACNAIGWLGLLLYNDNGEMMNRCYMTLPGDMVNFEMVLTDTESSIWDGTFGLTLQAVANWQSNNRESGYCQNFG